MRRTQIHAQVHTQIHHAHIHHAQWSPTLDRSQSFKGSSLGVRAHRALKGALLLGIGISALACEPQAHEESCGCSHDVPQLSEAQQALAIAGRWQPSASATSAANSASVPVTEAGPWEGESSCSGNFTEGAQALKRWLLDHWPQVSDVQGYSCRPINGAPGVTSIHAVGRALDIFIPLDSGEADNDLGDPVGAYLLEHAEEIGIQRVIWDRTIWTSGGTPREYGGAHPHHDHLHIELSVPAANQQTPFFLNGMPAPAMSACAPPLGAEGGVIDSESPCLNLYGPAQYWRSVGGEGYGGSLYWTNAWQSANPANWARWRFSVSQSGRYALAVHSVAAYSVYPQVRYKVRSADGEQTLTLNPAGRDGWVEVTEGRFEAGAGEYFVDVFDNYNVETGSDQHIIVDALRVTSLEAPPPPPVGGTEGPEAGAEPPVGGDDVPVAGIEPVAGQTAPEAGQTAPEAGQTTPEAGQTAPVGGTDAPYMPPVYGGTDDNLNPDEVGGFPWEMPSESQAKASGSSCDATNNRDTSPLLLLVLAALSLVGGRARRGERAL